MLCRRCPTVCIAGHAVPVLPFTARPLARRVNVKAQASPRSTVDDSLDAGRRAVLLGFVATSVAACSSEIAYADEVTYQTFFGLATPPTSYGGYGGNANEKPKYSFEYPKGWKSEVPSKVEKGTQGIDGRVLNPRSKDQRAFVICLSRAGEDDKSFKLTDLDSTFAGFSGADYNLQDALQSATSINKSERDVDGNKFYIYDIDSPDFRYLASITAKSGKVFALFVRSPARLFKTNEDKLRHIIDTFALL